MSTTTPSPASAPPPSSPPTPPAASPPAPSTNSTTPPPVSPPISTSSPPPTTPASSPPPKPPASSPPPTLASSPPPPTPVSSPPPTPVSSPPPTTPASSPPRTTPASSPPPPPTLASSPPPAPTLPGSSPPLPAPATPSVPSPPTVTPTPSTPSTPSPPAPRSGGSPPSTPGGTPTPRSPPSTSSSSSSSSVSTPVVVGIAVGAVLVLAFLTVLCFCCVKKKRRRPPPDAGYYGAPPVAPQPPRKDDIYDVQPQNWQHNVPPPTDRVVKIPPPAHASHPPHSPAHFPSPPPPPPPMFSSSGGSGSNYSGSDKPLLPLSPGVALGFSKSTFTYEELAMATNGFSDANLLGQGGFGYVHRGMLPSGKEVAIKQLKSGSGQGEREFQAEVEIISRVHHKHLVSLVGYSIADGKRLLVYEFVPNNTLEFHLHGKGRPTMEWSTRLKIALGSAKGLAYLHEDCHPKIIHRDIKAANILLDFKFEAKVADFGLAKIASDNNTHVSTRVMGTFGYMAPEYASSGKLTDRSDVFSFGVMLLELITGRRPIDSTNPMDDSLVEWARPLLTRALEDGNYGDLVDPQLKNNYNPDELAFMVACAAACVRYSAQRRPRMSQIVRVLEGVVSLDDLNKGVTPGHSTVYGSYGSTDYDSSQYKEDMKKIWRVALTSQEHGSSEYSGGTSEYGQNPSGSSSEGRLTREMESGKMKKDT